MRVQILSDLHIEMTRCFPIPNAKYLFLAGDIGNITTDSYKAFFDYVNVNWEKTFYVLSNHEFYDRRSNFHKTLESYRDFFKDYPNVFLLEKEKVILEDFTILGCTLWSSPARNVDKEINDFQLINIQKEDSLYKFKTTDCATLHKESIEWFRENYNPSEKTIFLTHFPTTVEKMSHPVYDTPTNDLISYFTNDLKLEGNLISISGHTHYSVDFTKNGVRYISNQRGYRGEESLYHEDEYFIL